MLRADETRVAVLLQQQVVDVLSRTVECVPVGVLHLVLDQVHGPAVDVDLARRPRGQKLSVG